jgi:hypothetical protein
VSTDKNSNAERRADAKELLDIVGTVATCVARGIPISDEEAEGFVQMIEAILLRAEGRAIEP